MSNSITSSSKQAKGVLGREPAADGLHDVRPLQRRDRVADGLDLHRAGLGVDVEADFGALLDFAHGLTPSPMTAPIRSCGIFTCCIIWAELLGPRS